MADEGSPACLPAARVMLRKALWPVLAAPCLGFLLRWSVGACLLMTLVLARSAGAAESIEAQLQEIAAQNRRLQEQVQAQQKVIEQLGAEVVSMRTADRRHERDLESLKERELGSPPVVGESRGESKLQISGEIGLGFFQTNSNGVYPNSEFRLDDAKLFVEAQVSKGVYAFTELNLFLREINDEAVHLGEVYVDFENVSGHWGADQLLSVRVGRFNIPFGEEYQNRGVIKNPLISHSLSDIWGVDEGIEAYGTVGPFQYVVAVQNGGHSLLHDYDSDKSITARVTYSPRRWLRLSASAMRTGDLAAKEDALSEVWIGNGFFKALGGAGTTRTFHAELMELDAVVKWGTGQVAAAVGQAQFDDDDTSRDNERTIDYYFLEASQNMGEKFFGAARYSSLRAPGGYSLIGWGTFGRHFYSGLLTDQLERFSLGLGYRIGSPLILKFEYGIENGRANTGMKRPQQTFISTEVGLKF